jgi:hypothetical protein
LGHGAAFAQGGPKKAPKRSLLIGARVLTTVTPASGFVDDPFGFDDAGGRLVLVNASVSGTAELNVLDLAQGGAKLRAVDITPFSAKPARVEFALDGEHYLVFKRDKDAGAVEAALLDKDGKIRHRFGPATDIRPRMHQGKQVLVLYKREFKSVKKGPPEVHHTVELRDVVTGRALARPRTLVADEGGEVRKLDFRIEYWTDDYTRAVGIKGGKWDRKEDQRSPDQEASYELVTGTFLKTAPIKDLIEHTREAKILAAHDNEPMFVTVANDLSSVMLYDRGVGTPIELTETLLHYYPKSLRMQPQSADGTIFFTLTIDPVHPDAAARRKAVPSYMDLYELAPGATKAKRRARILMRDKRERLWRATPDHWAVVPKHIGFDRGGKSLTLFALEKPL